jgi:hypothetical protein
VPAPGQVVEWLCHLPQQQPTNQPTLHWRLLKLITTRVGVQRASHGRSEKLVRPTCAQLPRVDVPSVNGLL